MKKRLFVLIGMICTLLLASCDFPFGGGSTSTNDVTTSTPIDETTTTPIDETTIVETNTQNEEKYIITWKNYDGAILKIDNNVKKGSIPSYTGEKPYSPYDGNYYYEFIGWSPELKEVDSDITYVAQFKSTKYINVNWVYGNNTYSEIVMPGTTPSYSGPTPTLDLDDGKEYVFVRWEPAVGEVYEDISYTAIFEPKISEYKINYELNYGKNNEDNPSSYKTDDSNITLKDPKRVGHNFVGWYYNDNYITEIDTSIHADITITAIWEPDEELALFDYTYDGTTYTITGIKDKLVEEINIPDYIDVIESEAFKGCSKLKTILIPGSVKRINDGAFADCDSLSYIIVPKQIEYFSINTFDSNSKTKVFYSGNKDEWNNLLNGDSLTQNVYFYSVGEPDYNQWNYVNNKPTIRKYTVVFNNYDGTPISTYKYEYGETIIAPDTPVKEADNTYTYEFAGWGSEVSICKGDYIYQAEFTPKYIDYVITFVNYDGTLISSNKYHYGATAIEVPENPTREADNTYTYGFAGWDSYIKECTEDKTYTATYIPIYIEYTITFINYDNGILSSNKYHYGDIVNEPSTPSKESNDIYTYEFAGWDKEVVACAGDATYYATYKSIYIEYEIAFIDYDDSLISANKYHYGDTVIQPNNPTRESDEMFTYEFAGWGREIEICKGNDAYKATYKSDYVEYEVIFVNYDGTVLSTNKYHYGDHIIVPPTPTKESDNSNTYSFVGWDSDVPYYCYDSKTYKAVFKADGIDYIVIFKDYNGGIISTNVYSYGESVIAPTDPTRDADETYTYEFAGWDKEVVACVGDATYQATYTATYIEYTITFLNYDGSIISENLYHYGDSVDVPSNPTREADNTYTYTFAGWDFNIVACTGNKTYTAAYTPTYIEYKIEFLNYDDSVLSTFMCHYGDIFTMSFVPTRDADETYTYEFAGWDRDVTACTGDTKYTATYTETYIEYAIAFYDYDGRLINSNQYHYGDAVDIPTNLTREADNTYTYEFAGWDKEVVECVGDSTYYATYNSIFIEYEIIFVNYDDSVITSNKYHYGDTISIPNTPTRDDDNTYMYSFDGWDREIVIVCDGNATYKATYYPIYIEYWVTFVNYDDSIITSSIFHYGDFVLAPSDPTKESDSSNTYTFIGWDSEVTSCYGNKTYKAVFKADGIDYIVIFKDYDGTVISNSVYSYGESIIAPTDPVREADKTYTYEFTGWDKQVAVTCVGDATYQATYTSTYIEYTITFLNYDGSVYSSNQYHYGDEVDIPVGPSKPSDKMYTYEFRSWGAAVITCYGDATYTPNYDKVEIGYLIQFIDYDNTIIASGYYSYGVEIMVPNSPSREADKRYNYEFSGWDKEIITKCDGDATYYATYTITDIYYTVVFKFNNWTNDFVSEYKYGDYIVFPADPVREDDSTYTFTFVGWSCSETICTGNMIYEAMYDLTYIDYTISFVCDGTLISENIYHFGELIIYPSIIPTKEIDNYGSYEFLRWSREDIICTGNLTIYAEFTFTYFEYTILFVNYDGTLISSSKYHYNDEVSWPNTIPTREADNAYTYEFIGYTPQVIPCKGDAVYTAKYASYYINYYVRFYALDNSYAEYQYHYGDAINEPEYFDVGVKESDEIYYYVFDKWDKEISICTGNQDFYPTFKPVYIEYQVIFFNDDYSWYSSGNYHYGDVISIPVDPYKEMDDAYTYEFSGWYPSISKGELCHGNYSYVATYTADPINTYNIYYELDYGVNNVSNIGQFTRIMENFELQEPTKIGHDFVGWYCNDELVTTIDTSITHDITLVAKWNAKSELDNYMFTYDGIDFTILGIIDSSITNLTIPQYVTKLGTDETIVFEDCTSLINIRIPKGIRYFGTHAFINCTSLENVYYDGDIDSWCDIEFSNAYSEGYFSNPMSRAKYFFLLDENGDKEYYGNTYSLLTNLEISNNISTIKRLAFYGFNCVNSIIISESVAKIEEEAFNGTSIENVTIPSNVVDISHGVFRNCRLLKTVSLPSNLVKIPSITFMDCVLLDSISIPSSVNEIGAEAFYNCTSLSSIIIPDLVENIGTSTFYNCTSLESINLPLNLSTIEWRTFDRCSNLKSILIPNSVTFIDTYAFNDCTSLSEVYYDGCIYEWINIEMGNMYSNPMYYGKSFYVKDNEGTISYNNNKYSEVLEVEVLNENSNLTYQLYGIKSIERIYLPNSIIAISQDAFKNCTSLNDIVISKNITEIGNDAFKGCTALENVYYNGDISDWIRISFENLYSNPMVYAKNFYILDENGTFEYNDNNYSTLEEIIIPSDITRIDYQLYNFKTVKRVFIPKSVEYIECSSFYGYSSLESITLPFIGDKRHEANDEYQYPFGYIFGYSYYDGSIEVGQQYLTYDGNFNYGNFYLPLSLNKIIVTDTSIIPYGGFASCRNIINVEFSSNITEIGAFAFYNCSLLKSINLPSTLTAIGDSAFFACKSLENVIIPDNIQEIKDLCFSNCTSLKSIVLSANLKIIGYSAFDYCTSLEIVELTSMLEEISSMAFRYSSIINLIIPDKVRKIGDSAFSDCNSLKNIIIEGENIVIGDQGISRCHSLEIIQLPKNISMGESVFYDCPSLTSVYYNGNTDDWFNINMSWFNPMRMSSNFYVLDDTGDTMFNNKHYSIITNLIVPNDIDEIGDYQYCGLKTLTTLTIGTNISSIGIRAFYDCDSLVTITYLGTVEEWNNISKGELCFHYATSKVICSDGEVDL